MSEKKVFPSKTPQYYHDRQRNKCKKCKFWLPEVNDCKFYLIPNLKDGRCLIFHEKEKE